MVLFVKILAVCNTPSYFFIINMHTKTHFIIFLHFQLNVEAFIFVVRHANSTLQVHLHTHGQRFDESWQFEIWPEVLPQR